jgi:hypothetical protein
MPSLGYPDAYDFNQLDRGVGHARTSNDHHARGEVPWAIQRNGVGSFRCSGFNLRDKRHDGGLGRLQDRIWPRRCERRHALFEVVVGLGRFRLCGPRAWR